MPRGGRNVTPALGIAEQLLERIGQGRNVAGRDEHAASIAERIRYPGHVGPDDRRPDSHGFANHIGQAVAKSFRGMHQDGGFAHRLEDSRKREPSAQPQPIGDAQLRGQRAQRVTLVTVADELEAEVVAALRQECGGANQIIKAFVFA